MKNVTYKMTIAHYSGTRTNRERVSQITRTFESLDAARKAAVTAKDALVPIGAEGAPFVGKQLETYQDKSGGFFNIGLGKPLFADSSMYSTNVVIVYSECEA